MSPSKYKAASVMSVSESSDSSFDPHDLDFLHSSDGASTESTAATDSDQAIITTEIIEQMEDAYIDRVGALIDDLGAYNDPRIYNTVQNHLRADQFPSATLREIRTFNGPDLVLRVPVPPTPGVSFELPTRSRRSCPHCGSTTHNPARCWFLSRPGDAPGSFVLPNMTPARLTHFQEINHPALPQGVVLISGTFNLATNRLVRPVRNASGSTTTVPDTTRAAGSGPANGRGGRRPNKAFARHASEAPGSATTAAKASNRPAAPGPSASGPSSSGPSNQHRRRRYNNEPRA